VGGRRSGEAALPVTLELGGKGPHIVFADADLDAALPVLVNAIVQNAGQTCSAGSRLLVERQRYEEVLDKLGRASRRSKSGPALDDLDCGPLIRASQLERVRGFLDDAKRDGRATVAKGTVVAARAAATAYYVEPQLLRDVPPDSGSAARKCSARCSRRCRSRTKPMRCASPTPRSSDSSPACGQERRAADAHGSRHQERPGVHQQLWRGRWRRAAVRRRQAFGVRSRKGFEALHGFTVLKTVVFQHG
jgi:aldehyde dehydrogenase (NAD+)